MSAEPGVGQVWELSFEGEMRPCLLLSFPHGDREKNRVWEVLDLVTGDTAWADERRWLEPSWGGGTSLLGRRLL